MIKKVLGVILSVVMVLSCVSCLSVLSFATGESGLSFSLNTAGTAYIVARCDPQSSGNIIIPSIYNNKPVERISGFAFQECHLLTGISIPDSVLYIDSYAFYNCTSLAGLTIPDSVTSIGSEVFNGCSSLVSISVSSGNTVYSSFEGVLFNKAQTLLICCPADKSGTFTIPNGVTRIEDNGFENCTLIQSVTISDTVASIGNGAFYGCIALTGITLPNSVTSIDVGAFLGCTSLKNISFSNSLTSIGDGAFCNCTLLTNVIIPISVTSIGENALGYNINENDEFIKMAGFTISGVKGSAAETYATSNGFAFVSVDIYGAAISEVDYSNHRIIVNSSGITSIDELIGKADGITTVGTASFTGGENKYYGTGSSVAVYENGELVSEYTVIVMGDLNGDSVCDVFDALQAEYYSCGIYSSPDQNKIVAANAETSGAIDASAYQFVVNIALKR